MSQRQILLRAAKLAREIPVCSRGTAWINFRGVPAALNPEVDGSQFTRLGEIDDMIAQGQIKSACTVGFVMMAQRSAEWEWFGKLWDKVANRISPPLPYSYHNFATSATQAEMAHTFERLAQFVD